MKAAYMDTSALLSLLFEQDEASSVTKALKEVDEVVSSDLILCETLSACCREKVAYGKASKWLDRINLVQAALDEELISSILAAHYLRGANLHHLATALWLFDTSRDEVLFASLDQKQSNAARHFGFEVI